MIHVIATIELVAGTRDQFLNVLRHNLPNVRAEDGCIEYGPAVDLPAAIGVPIPQRDDVVTILEKWRDLAALQAHLSAPHMIAYRGHVKPFVARVSLQVLQPV